MDIQSLLPDSWSEVAWVALGLAAAFGFMMRQVIQWILSERAGKVLSPTIYWQISLAASFLFICYGVGRHDLAIITGQLLSYYIYVRNLQLKAAWSSLGRIVQFATLCTPIIALIGIFYLEPDIWTSTWTYARANAALIGFGTVGFIVMATRFVYQWYISERRKESVLPMGFWLISISGALLLFIYGWQRKDIVLLASNSLNILLYLRNIALLNKSAGRA